MILLKYKHSTVKRLLLKSSYKEPELSWDRDIGLKFGNILNSVLIVVCLLASDFSPGNSVNVVVSLSSQSHFLNYFHTYLIKNHI